MPYQVGVTIRAEVRADHVPSLRKWLAEVAGQGLAKPSFGFPHLRQATHKVAADFGTQHRDLPRFVQTRGGASFFLPGISAPRYLAQLPGPVPSGPRTG